jgi:hypothetical protein
LVAFCLFLAICTVALAVLFASRHPDVVEFATSPSSSRLRATGLILFDEINEGPHLNTEPVPSGPRPICSGVEGRQVAALNRALALMRGTERGAELYSTLIDHDVCVTVTDIPYNGGYATSWRSPTGEWFHGTITLDDDYMSSRQADVLAAMLVHEAVHIERAINGESCDDRADCELLPNGVELDEEVAAHAAEAEWWLAAYGDDGKRFAIGPDYGENELADAYRDGPLAFRDYVRDLRSDPREGVGI